MDEIVSARFEAPASVGELGVPTNFYLVGLPDELLDLTIHYGDDTQETLQSHTGPTLK